MASGSSKNEAPESTTHERMGPDARCRRQTIALGCSFSSKSCLSLFHAWQSSWEGLPAPPPHPPCLLLLCCGGLRSTRVCTKGDRGQHSDAAQCGVRSRRVSVLRFVEPPAAHRYQAAPWFPAAEQTDGCRRESSHPSCRACCRAPRQLLASLQLNWEGKLLCLSSLLPQRQTMPRTSQPTRQTAELVRHQVKSLPG